MKRFFYYLNTHDYAYFIFWSVIITLFCLFVNSLVSVFVEHGEIWGIKHFFMCWWIGFFMSFYFHWRRKIGRPVYKDKKQIT